MQEFNVLDTQPAEAQALRAEPENMLLLYFFFATVFMSILLILTLSLCLVQRTRYRRQIKAATVNAFGQYLFIFCTKFYSIILCI